MENLETKTLLAEFHSYGEILRSVGLDVPDVTESEFISLPLNEQRRIVRSMKESARTPRT